MIVYAILNKVNGKLYVGKTEGTFEQRWNNHKYTARRGKKTYFAHAIRKYGEDAFEFFIIYLASDLEDLNRAEIEYIQKFRTKEKEFGYNLTDGGEGATGSKHSEETRLRIGKVHRGKIVSEETRRKMSVSAQKREHPPHTQETRRKLSEIGRGHVVTEETRRKISDANKGKPNPKISEIQKEKTGSKNPFWGKTHSAESLRKISEAKKGVPNLKARGLKRSPEQRQRIGNGHQRNKARRTATYLYLGFQSARKAA